ncbi:MAG TPA: CoA transferase [Solirubrobacteraceae bacterium]|nr:CoA transferase [Solirubrobacteraceae bacterium]
MNAISPLLNGTTVGVCGGSRPLHAAARWLADLGAQTYAVGDFAPEPADLEWLGALPPLPAGTRLDVLLTRAAAPSPGVPAAVRVAVTGSGATAPDPRRELSEVEACAAGGIAVAIGNPEMDPLPLPNGAMDSLVGAHVAAAAVAALIDGRSETEVAAADVGAWLVATNIRMYQPYGARWHRDGRRASGSGGCYPYGLFEAEDGLFCLIGRGPEHWATLTEMVGAPALLEDESFRDPRLIARTAPAAADALIGPWIARHSRQQLTDQMIAAKFPGGPVQTCAEVLALDSFAGRWRRFGEGLTVAPDRPYTTIEGAAVTPAPKRLEGLRVLDLAWVWSGPAASAALGDLGAQVVKVESASRPDNTRLRGASIVRPPAADAPPLEVTEYFHALNRGKQSVALDLKTAAGREMLRRLADQADVIIENLSPGVMARWGIAPEAVLETNPTCTFISMRGFGEHASLRDLRAYAPVLTSAAGVEELIRYEGQASIGGMTVGFSDALAASHALLLALAGAHSAARRGHGAAITLSQFEGAVTANGRNLVDAQHSGAIPPAPLSDRLDYVVAGEGLAHSPWVSSDLFTTVSSRWLEPVPVCKLPWRRDGAFPAVRGGAPELGSDTRQVLGQWLGVDAAGMERLVAAGAHR